MSDTHGAADTGTAAVAAEPDFDTEFETARAAEAEPDGPGSSTDDDTPAAEVKPPLDADTTAKRLADTQAALKKERAEKRDLNTRLAALEAKVTSASAPGEKKAALADMPDPEVDPIGAVKFLTDKIKADEERAAAKDTEAAKLTEAQQKNAQAFKVLSDAMTEHEDDFRELHPDYDDAAEHFAKSRREELAETGLTGKELDNALANDLTGIVARALRANKDPAEIVYNLAKKRGFSLDTSATKLQTIQSGQKAAKSLGTGGDGDGASSLTYGTVSKLSGAAFDSAFEKLKAQERRAG